ncbi:hypothetical protein VTI74DRAFT_4871 [Chaetomium olivicolor]
MWWHPLLSEEEARPTEAPDATFNLLDLQSGFIVLRDGRPGTPAPPTSEAEAEALLANIDNWHPPLFKFEQPAGAPEGVFDLVLEDLSGKHYVSWGNDGAVSFVEQSSALTTLFTVNCRGHLTIRKGGASYTWRVTRPGLHRGCAWGERRRHRGAAARDVQGQGGPGFVRVGNAAHAAADPARGWLDSTLPQPRVEHLCPAPAQQAGGEPERLRLEQRHGQVCAELQLGPLLRQARQLL